MEDKRESDEKVANMPKLDFLLLLWEARIIGEDYVKANTQMGVHSHPAVQRSRFSLKTPPGARFGMVILYREHVFHTIPSGEMYNPVRYVAEVYGWLAPGQRGFYTSGGPVFCLDNQVILVYY